MLTELSLWNLLEASPSQGGSRNSIESTFSSPNHPGMGRRCQETLPSPGLRGIYFVPLSLLRRMASSCAFSCELPGKAEYCLTGRAHSLRELNNISAGKKSVGPQFLGAHARSLQCCITLSQTMGPWAAACSLPCPPHVETVGAGAWSGSTLVELSMHIVKANKV